VPSYEELVAEAIAASFEGWDFSRLRTRAPVTPLPWRYGQEVASRADGTERMLDMDTGGGETLLRIPARAAFTVAIESWVPNVPVAAAALRPHGIAVVQDEGSDDNMRHGGVRGRLPFRGEAFDVVANRHGAFLASEVARVLRPGGWFVTQQVDFHTYDDFYAALGIDQPPEDDSWLPLAVDQVTASGLDVVDSRTGVETQAFGDVGALVWYLRAVTWSVPEFDVVRCEPALRRIHERMQHAPLLIRQRRFLLIARRRDPTPAAT
jgi:SAM-dependent methyltransferase